VVRRQVELLQETMNQAAAALRDLSKSGSPTEAVAKQTELAKQSFERAVATMRELADIVAKSNQEAAGIVNARIAASMSEIQELIMKIRK
jgi:phasin family protein